MNYEFITQQISLDILQDPSKACMTNQLDVLEREDASLSQLHPLAKVIALSERGRGSKINKKMLENATKTIVLSGICETCEEKSDELNLTYYEINKMRRGSFSLICFNDSVYHKDIKVEFQLACAMNGESMDGFTAAKSRVSINTKDLQIAADLINKYGKKKKWIDCLLSAKIKECSSLDPGFNNLGGVVAIYLEGVCISIDDQILKVLDLPNIPVADLQYSVGELVETCIHVPIDESSEFGEKSFLPNWLAAVAEEIVFKLEAYYRKHLSSETEPGVLEQLNQALLSIDEWLRDSQYRGLYIDLAELIDLEKFTIPLFRKVCFEISSKKYLPPYFKASEHIRLGSLAELLLKMRDIDLSTAAHST